MLSGQIRPGNLFLLCQVSKFLSDCLPTDEMFTQNGCFAPDCTIQRPEIGIPGKNSTEIGISLRLFLINSSATGANFSPLAGGRWGGGWETASTKYEHRLLELSDRELLADITTRKHCIHDQRGGLGGHRHGDREDCEYEVRA